MPKITVDKEKCQGYGTCVSICPKVFKIGADGKAEVISEAACEGGDCQRAAASCPTQAITVEE